MGSASTRPSAASTSTRSTESGSTRERICSSASSTVSTSLLYYTPPRSSSAWGLVAGVREIQDGLEVAEEPASAQHEQREEPRGDREVAQPERQPGRGRDRRKHDEHPLEEDRDKPEDRDHEEGGVALGRPTGERFDED